MVSIGTNYHLEIEVLSPVHIGSGRPDLVDDLDYVRGRVIFVIDQERMLAGLPPERWARAEEAAPLSRLLTVNEYARFARYSLSDPTGGKGVPRILDQIKDARGRPYLPGSSLKGAIRTAVAWAMLAAGEQTVEPGALGQNPRFADDPLEAELFGRDEQARWPRVDPNRDLLRALQVSDSQPVAIEQSVELAQVALYSLSGSDANAPLRSKGEQWRFFVEALRPGTRLEASVRIDDFLLQAGIARHVGMDGKQEWVRGWMAACNGLSRAVIAHERDFYARHPVPRVKAFYDSLAAQAEAAETRRECLLQISWGTGWLSKTVGTALEESTLEELRGAYNLGRRGYPIFPKSRRLVERGTAAEMPLGWVRLRLAGDASAPPAPRIDAIGAPREREPIPPSTSTPEEPASHSGGAPSRLEDLRPNMILEGTVRRITDFGAFVDVGVGRDGLVHISQLSERRVEDVDEVVKVGQRVRVKVLNVDLDRQRIGLSMKGVPQEGKPGN